MNVLAQVLHLVSATRFGAVKTFNADIEVSRLADGVNIEELARILC